MRFGGSADAMHTHHRKANLTFPLLNKRMNNRIRQKNTKIVTKWRAVMVA